LHKSSNIVRNKLYKIKVNIIKDLKLSVMLSSNNKTKKKNYWKYWKQVNVSPKNDLICQKITIHLHKRKKMYSQTRGREEKNVENFNKFYEYLTNWILERECFFF